MNGNFFTQSFANEKCLDLCLLLLMGKPFLDELGYIIKVPLTSQFFFFGHKISLYYTEQDAAKIFLNWCYYEFSKSAKTALIKNITE